MIAAQGIYYWLTGLWPPVSIESFELVTGPETDDWLPQTVGLLRTSRANPHRAASFTQQLL